jgi:hypothetical protein
MSAAHKETGKVMNSTHNLPEPEFEALLREAVSLPDVPSALRHKAYAAATQQQASAMGATAATLGKTLAHAASAAITQTGRGLQAVLTFDSWTMSPAKLGLRSTSMDTRQMLFSAGSRDVDIRVTPKENSFVLGGQILGDFGVGSMSLSIDTHERSSSPKEYGLSLDELGSFRVSSIPPGLARLMLTIDDQTITLPAFEIRKRN